MQGASRNSLRELRDQLGRLAAGATSQQLQQFADDLFAVVTLLASQGSLRRAISDPALEGDAKRRVVQTLFGQRLSAGALELTAQVAAARWSQPVDVVDALEAIAVEASLGAAEADDQLDEVEDQLFRFQRIVDGTPELRAALTDRNLPADRKQQLVHRLLDDKAAKVTVSLVERAVLAPRGRTIERVIGEFTNLAAQRRDRLIARVTAAVALTADQQERLREALAREFGRDVRLQLVVDPHLIGGVTVRVGDELIDDSVIRHLSTARRQLSGRARG
jgi:F-type H+-transporting ATPase subunit delta